MSPGPWVTRQNGVHVTGSIAPDIGAGRHRPSVVQGSERLRPLRLLQHIRRTNTRAPCITRSSGRTASDPNAGAAGLLTFAIGNKSFRPLSGKVQPTGPLRTLRSCHNHRTLIAVLRKCSYTGMRPVPIGCVLITWRKNTRIGGYFVLLSAFG